MNPLQHRRCSCGSRRGALRRACRKQRVRALLMCLPLHLLDGFGDERLALLRVRAARHDLGDELRPLVDLCDDRAVRKDARDDGVAYLLRPVSCLCRPHLFEVLQHARECVGGILLRGDGAPHRRIRTLNRRVPIRCLCDDCLLYRLHRHLPLSPRCRCRPAHLKANQRISGSRFDCPHIATFLKYTDSLLKKHGFIAKLCFFIVSAAPSYSRRCGSMIMRRTPCRRNSSASSFVVRLISASEVASTIFFMWTLPS